MWKSKVLNFNWILSFLQRFKSFSSNQIKPSKLLKAFLVFHSKKFRSFVFSQFVVFQTSSLQKKLFLIYIFTKCSNKSPSQFTNTWIKQIHPKSQLHFKNGRTDENLNENKFVRRELFPAVTLRLFVDD